MNDKIQSINNCTKKEKPTIKMQAQMRIQLTKNVSGILYTVHVIFDISIYILNSCVHTIAPFL